MSIGPAVVATPLTQAPVAQTPASASAGSGGTPSQAEFSSMLNSAAATSPAPQLAPEPKPLAQGLIAPHNRLGDQVLNGLQKLGKSVEAMGSFGATPHGTTSSATKPSASAAPSQGNPATQDFNSNLRDMQAIWEGGMQRQKQLYQTVFEFQVVQESAQSMMKSLKSLLTQGGG